MKKFNNITMFFFAFIIFHFLSNSSLSKDFKKDTTQLKSFQELDSLKTNDDRVNVDTIIPIELEKSINCERCIKIIRDIVEILFYIIVALFTMLAFFKAKDTILSPFRSEVAKNLNNIFQQILSLFSCKSEEELINDAHFDDLLEANFFKIQDMYLVYVLDYNLTMFCTSLSDKPYYEKKCPQNYKIQISNKPVDWELIKMERALELGSIYKPQTQEQEISIDDKIKIWKNHEFNHICLHQNFIQFDEKLQGLISSPILPQKCVKKLIEYRKRIYDNIKLLSKVLKEYAKELPEKYKSIDIQSIYWNTFQYKEYYYSKFEPLKPEAEEIVGFFRTLYNKIFKTDKLF